MADERWDCAQCRSEHTQIEKRSPVPGVWQAWRCLVCGYWWHSSESADRNRHEQFPELYQVDPAAFPSAPAMPPVAPLPAEPVGQ